MSWLDKLLNLHWGEACLAALGAYVLGCFATGYYLIRAVKGQDVRTLGSGNIGARNVGRLVGVWGFLFTLVGDAGKGVLAVWAAFKFFPDERILALVMLAVVAGHIWPATLGFRGGKGVATSLGALAVFDWHLLIAYALVFGCSWLAARRTILPGLFAFLCLPGADYWLHADGFRVLVLSLLALMVLFAHRKNILEEIPHLNATPGTSSNPE